MEESPEGIELRQRFQEIDATNKGYISSYEFTEFINTQPRKLSFYTINSIFSQLPNQQMDVHQFIILMMGYRLNMEQLVISRFGLHRELKKHEEASPPAGAPIMKESFMKLRVAAQEQVSKEEKKRLSFRLGRNRQEQQNKFQTYKAILGRPVATVLGVIKFQVDGDHSVILNGLTSVIDSAINLAGELDEELSRVIQLFEISVRSHGQFIYIFVEIDNLFINDMSNFLNEMVQMLTPNSEFRLQLTLLSDAFKDILKQGGLKKAKDFEVDLSLQIDSESMAKAKKIMLSNSVFSNEHEKKGATFMCLLEEVQLEAEFANSQELVDHFGVAEAANMALEQTEQIKGFCIAETLEGFIPESGEVINALKNQARGVGLVEINLGEVGLGVEFNLEIEGLLNLL